MELNAHLIVVVKIAKMFLPNWQKHQKAQEVAIAAKANVKKSIASVIRINVDVGRAVNA